MDHSSEQPHEIQIHSMENTLVVPCPKTQQENNNIKSKAQQEQALKCPRCDSINTKFCYYNNYSLSQPRYFCKSCRRYWTKGGTLRNIPVGGGCRKNHKRSSPPSSSLSSSKKSHDHQPFTANSNSNPMMLIDGHSHFPSLAYDSSSTDLSLAFAKFQNQSNGQMGLFESQNNFHNMYYGFGSGSSGELENGVQMPSFEGYNGTAAVTVPTMKQEVCNGDQNMVLWGFPWQFSNNGGGNYSADIDSAERERWNFNGNNGTFWHGLVNSPLM